jgi:hypothetical protein
MVVQALTYREAPAGSVLHVRLTNAVGSFASRPGAPVDGVLIAPVKLEGETVLPVGTIVHGNVKSVRRVGLGILHEAASMDLNFDSISLPGGTSLPVWTKLASVDNGREEVTPSGSIRKSRSTGNWGNRAAHYLRDAMLINVHAQIAAWAVKSVVMQVPEPEIYLPSGAELTLVLTAPVRTLSTPNPLDDSRGFTEEQRVSLAPVISDLPDRSFAPKSKKVPTGRAADIVNLLLIGSREQIAAAFTAAGWVEARRNTPRANWGSAFAATFNYADRNAPMSSLRVNNVEADMAWEKGFDDVSKRHHIRLWKMEQSWEGQELWVAAATRDVEMGFLRPGRVVTHRVEEQVDHERDKIAWDLAFASCADALDWWDRPAVPRDTHNATGDRMQTDGQLVVVQVNDCSHPRGVAVAGQDTLPVHGNLFQRLLRREILSARSDLIRSNVYWKSYEGLRLLVSAIESHRQTPEPDAAPKRTFASRMQPGGLTSFVSFR